MNDALTTRDGHVRSHVAVASEKSSERDTNDLPLSRWPKPEVRHVQRAVGAESQARREAQPRREHGARAVRRDARHARASRRWKARCRRLTGERLQHVEIALVVGVQAEDRREAA